MSTSRTHTTLPEGIRADLDRLVEKRNRSRFIAEAVRRALLIARQKEALQHSNCRTSNPINLEYLRRRSD